MQVVQELALAEDEIRFKALLPCAKCSIYDLPDSDGMYCTLLAVTFRCDSNSLGRCDKYVETAVQLKF